MVASWRLLRVGAHVLHGAWVVGWRFRRLDLAQRRARIGWWSRKLLRLAGVDLIQHGVPPASAGLFVANHVSWLDIAVVHAACPQARFVSKADVRRWPVLNRMIDAAGTLYLERERRRDAQRVVHEIGETLARGDVVAVFPEGTTGEGPELLPFHANLLQAAIGAQVPVHPLSLRYAQPGVAYSPAVVFVGETTMLQSLWSLLGARGLQVHLHFLPAQSVEGLDRRALATRLRERIAATLPAARPSPPR